MAVAEPASSVPTESRPSAARLEPYLRERLGKPDARVLEVDRLARGVSRETWVVRLAAADGSVPTALALRRDLPGGSVCDTPLEFEYEVYRRLMASPVPVAHVLWYEHEPERSGGGSPFYVREFVDGRSDIPHLLDPDPVYDDLRVESSKEHLRKLALLHTCDWAGLGFGDILDAPPDAESCATHTLDRLSATFEALRLEAYPEITEAIFWLRDNAPEAAPRVSLLKGNNGLGEEVWRDGEIVAMSDWELASLGDPTYDFAQLQDLIPEVRNGDDVVWNFQKALDFYADISGIRIEPRSLDYYRTMHALSKANNALSCIRMLAEGRDHQARLAWCATEVLYRARRTLAVVAGILPRAMRTGGLPASTTRSV